MTSAADLLPDSAGPFEVALAEAITDTLPVTIREALDPATAPVDLLPWLAVNEGVRLWYSDWSEERKRLVISEALMAAFLVGTRDGSIKGLSYVDGTLVDALAYPRRFIFGRSFVGSTPINHPPFVARYLIKVATTTPKNALVLGRAVLGRAALRTPDRDPLKRCLAALRAFKAPETEIRVDFGYKRPLTIADAPLLDGSHHLDEYIERTKI